MSASGPNELLSIDQLCPHCHAGLRADAVRCWHCGANVCEDRETEIATAVLATSWRDWVVLIAVLCCYLVSFILPTTIGSDGIPSQNINAPTLGWEVFLQVILNLPFSIGYLPAWFANCILCSGLLALIEGRWRSARISAWLCVVLALSALLPRTSMTILMGYYVWLLSMVMFLVGSEVIGITARRRSNRGFGSVHGIEPMSVDANHDYLPIEAAAGGFARQIALGLWVLQLFATALAVLSAMGDVTMVIATGLPLAIIGLALALVTRRIHCRPVSLFGLSAPLLFACCVLLFAWYDGPKQAAVPIQTLLVLYALFALPAAAIARRHILRWSLPVEPTGWQFSLKSLLILVTVLAVVLACVGTAVNLDAAGHSQGTILIGLVYVPGRSNDAILLGLCGVATLAVTAGAACFVFWSKARRRATNELISPPVREDPAQ